MCVGWKKEKKFHSVKSGLIKKVCCLMEKPQYWSLSLKWSANENWTFYVWLGKKNDHSELDKRRIETLLVMLNFKILILRTILNVEEESCKSKIASNLEPVLIDASCLRMRPQQEKLCYSIFQAFLTTFGPLLQKSSDIHEITKTFLVAMDCLHSFEVDQFFFEKKSSTSS